MQFGLFRDFVVSINGLGYFAAPSGKEERVDQSSAQSSFPAIISISQHLTHFETSTDPFVPRAGFDNVPPYEPSIYDA